MKKALYVLGVSIFILSCVGMEVKRGVQDNTFGGVPHFEGYISPITVPFQPVYKPVSFNFMYSVKESVKEEVNSSTEESGYILCGKATISKIEDKLIWDYKITKIVMDGKTYAPDIPIIEYQMFTDSYGAVQEVDLSFPDLQRRNADNQKLDIIGNNIKQLMRQSTKKLPNKPVRSGDCIYKTEKDSIKNVLNFAEITDKETRETVIGQLQERGFSLEEANNIMDSLAKEMSEKTKISKDIECIVKGWSYFNKKKVLVVSANEIANINYRGIPLQLKIIGFILHDSETFAVLSSEQLLTVITDPSNKDTFFKYKTHQSFSAELTD